MRPKRNAGPWSVIRILNPTSPILDDSRDIHQFIITCLLGWEENYDEDEKKSIIDSLPTRYRRYETDQNGKLVFPISLDFISQDQFIKATTLKFRNDINDGYYEKNWRDRSSKAMIERKEGKFDEYLKDYTNTLFELDDDEDFQFNDGSNDDWNPNKKQK